MIKMLQEADRPAFLTFVGTALIKFATGIIGIWGAINIYFLSYLHNNGVTITPLTNSIIMLCAIIPSSFTVLMSTRLAKRFGYKRVVRVCSFIFALTPFIINFSMNLVTLGLCYILIPVSCFAISSIPILNCLWSQFPNDLNKISGLAVLFFALGMIVWNLIFLHFTNPNNESAEIDSQNQAFFSEHISQNIFKSSNIMFIMSGSCFVIGSFLISKKNDNPSPVNRLAEQSPPPAEKDQTSSGSADFTLSEDKSHSQITSQKQSKLSSSLRDKKFLILWTISLLQPMYLIYMTLYMKLTFMPIINDDHYLAYCSVVVTVSAIVGAPFWGFLGDKIGFKATLLIVVICDIISKIFGLFCQQKWNLILIYFMLGFNDKGILTIIGPGLIQIFGLELATELIPYKGISLFLAYVTVPLFQIILSSTFPYQAILTVFVGTSGIAVALAYHFYSKITYQASTDHLAKQNCPQLQEDKNIECVP